ncbi:MAG: SH3 domain-containing protein [Alphaproteobacteria bacterium]|nr:SH3 domain-containing protein [Alphaproteobacteria bacterium]MBU1551405.1 SH3 domain-containing protein [Alphaproteobacteria bacterium]MBU2334412.1 SH3 domain-containing protein [Alphaproteobacteria bacterium]MBU2389953.1 SH3 domain-containing protein [Alphaproteobacteria bacterium]
MSFAGGKHVKKHLLSAAAALCALVALPSIADAAVRGFSTANVNMRSGPSTSYPAVTVIPEGSPVTIYGCMSSVNWCDVAFSGGRGWVSGNYVQAAYRQRRVEVGPRYYQPLGIPTVTFEIGNYWDRHYRGRDFYRDRDRWDRGGRGPDRDRGGWDRDRRDRDRGDWDRRDRDRRDWDRDRRDGDRSDWRGDGDRDGSRQVGVITSPDGQVCFVGEERCLRRD